jgi:hypothetical protein
VALVRALIECVFIRVVTELETCLIYEVVLQTIKVAARNLSGYQISKHNTTKTRCRAITPREGINQSKTTMFTIKIDLTSSRFS